MSHKLPSVVNIMNPSSIPRLPGTKKIFSHVKSVIDTKMPVKYPKPVRNPVPVRPPPKWNPSNVINRDVIKPLPGKKQTYETLKQKPLNGTKQQLKNITYTCTDGRCPIAFDTQRTFTYLDDEPIQINPSNPVQQYPFYLFCDDGVDAVWNGERRKFESFADALQWAENEAN